MLIQLNTSNLCKNHSCRALYIQVWLFVPAALCTGEKVILSLHDQPEWGRIYTHPNEEFDLEAVTDEVVGVVRKGLEEHPDIGAVVLECTDLPPYSARIRDELDIPVFDINTMISYVAMALNEYKMF